jgi:hypothetical protein
MHEWLLGDEKVELCQASKSCLTKTESKYRKVQINSTTEQETLTCSQLLGFPPFRGT